MEQRKNINNADKLLRSLNNTELAILHYIARRFNKPLIYNVIAESLGLSYATVVRIVSKLVELKILDKKPGPVRGKGFCYDANFDFSEQIFLDMELVN